MQQPDNSEQATVLAACSVKKWITPPQKAMTAGDENSAGADETLTILNDVNLQIKAGETVSLVGRSGAGKSTLLALLAGLDSASSGKIHLLGEELGSLDEDQRAALRAGRVGFVFQSFQLLAGLTALENVMLPLELAGIGQQQARNEAMETLVAVGLKSRSSHRPSELSGGEQQRVALARAFAMQPEMLFADEPTGNLDEETGAAIIELLFRLNKERGTTLLLVTHDPALAAHCDRQLTLRDGRLHENTAAGSDITSAKIRK